MSNEPYLICHLVRGEPAFDIAIQMKVEGYEEPWWIIPTSGHRAYPYWSEKLYSVNMGGDSDLENVLKESPSDWPDHYAASRPGHKNLDEFGEVISKADAEAGVSLLDKLGIKPKPKEPIQRRV